MNTQATVMVAEDDRPFRELLVMALKAYGLDVLCAATAQQAIALLNHREVGLLLLDLRLGQESGLEMLKKIRQLPNGHGLPVVLLTGYSNRDSVMEIARLGVQGYVLKRELAHDSLLERIGQFVHLREVMPRRAPEVPLPTASQFAKLTRASQSEEMCNALASIRPVTTSQHVLEQIDRGTTLKALSSTVTQLLNMTSGSDCSIADIATVVQRDPVISLKILQIANSVVYNRAGSVDTEQKALSRIGLTRIRQLILNISVVDRFQLPALGEHFDGRLFWEHSIATGLIAAAIARFRGENENAIDNAFTAGLLHDVARMVLAEQLGDLYKQVLDTANQMHLPLEQVESRMLLSNHADLMERVLSAWEFPEHLVEPIAMHHQSLEKIRTLAPDAITRVCTLALADRLAHALLIGSSGNDSQYPTRELAEILQVSENAFQFIEDEIPEQAREMRMAMIPTANDSAWPDYSQAVRRQLKQPIRPIYIAAKPEIDSYRIFWDRISDRSQRRKPNLAVLHLTDAREQASLTKNLLECESNYGVGPLPLLIISPLTNLQIDSMNSAGRVCKRLPSPFTSSHLIQIVNNELTLM